MTIHHDLHAARLEIARLREALRDAVAALGGIKSDDVPDTVREALGEPIPARLSLSDYIADHNALYDRWRESLRRKLYAALTPPASDPHPAPEAAGASAPSRDAPASCADSPARDHA